MIYDDLTFFLKIFKKRFYVKFKFYEIVLYVFQKVYENFQKVYENYYFEILINATLIKLKDLWVKKRPRDQEEGWLISFYVM